MSLLNNKPLIPSWVQHRAARLLLGLMNVLILLSISGGLLFALTTPQELPFASSEAAMMAGEKGFIVKPLLTIGETLSGTTGALNPTTAGPFTPVGVPDGIGAYELNTDTVRVFVNHEVSSTAAYSYQVTAGLSGTLNLTGARISYFDIDTSSRMIVDGGLAYNTIYDRAYNLVTSTAQLDTLGGLDRFCSAALFEAQQFGAGRGLTTTIYFAGEERDNGTEWALNVSTGELWAVPQMGRGAWENVAALDTGTDTEVAFLLGDDRPGAPLYLYIGQKEAVGDDSFLDNNGLKQGQLYAWRADTGETTPAEFNGSTLTQTLTGTWAAIDVRDQAQAGNLGYDDLGYKDDVTLRAEALLQGAFSFSRPEDVSTHPLTGTQAVVASTGRSNLFGGADSLGTIYQVDVDFTNITSPTADLTILYDGDADPTQALRSPDNLDWADDGYIYVQEDRAFNPAFGLNAVNPHEASILQLDPATGAVTRVAEMNRSAVPSDQTDTAPNDVGRWESSGILDVSTLFGVDPGQLFLFNVQAHSLQGGVIASANLVQGGQMALLLKAESQLFLPIIIK